MPNLENCTLYFLYYLYINRSSRDLIRNINHSHCTFVEWVANIFLQIKNALNPRFSRQSSTSTHSVNDFLASAGERNLCTNTDVGTWCQSVNQSETNAFHPLSLIAELLLVTSTCRYLTNCIT